MKKNIGVLAFQGDVVEHQLIIEKLGHKFVAVRSKKDLDQVEALIIPGGESTTIGFFLEETGLDEEIKKRSGMEQLKTLKKTDQMTSEQHNSEPLMPIWGTCAGAILLANHIKSDIVPPHLGLMDITVKRNAYGRQIDSFYANVQIPSLKIHDLKTAFIRAPIILKVGANCEILALDHKDIILVQQQHLLASTFHPELTGDTRLHEYFISLIC